MQKYDMLVERIARVAGITQEEVESKVEAKKDKLSGLISKEGAAQIIAAELGISFEDQDVKVNELMPGMKKVNIIGKVVNIFPVREFNKNGREGKVANFIIADDTGSTRAVLWDVKHIELIETEKVIIGSVVEIKNGSVRGENEVHLGGFSEMTLSKKELGEVKTQRAVTEGKLDEAREGQSLKTRGVVVQLFQPRFYSVCPECNKKAIQNGEEYSCAEHGKVTPKDRAILNFVIDDGSESMRIVMFSDQINKIIPEEDLKDENKVTTFRDDFIGTEINISGSVKLNKFFNNLEIIANDIEKIDVEKLIEELEA